MGNHIEFGCYNHDGDEIHIDEVVEVMGWATIVLIRGKCRPGWDIYFECKWTGNVMVDRKRKKVKGTLIMNDISSEDAEEDWEYEVKVKKSATGYRIAKSVLEKDENKRKVIAAINVFINEFKAK